MIIGQTKLLKIDKSLMKLNSEKKKKKNLKSCHHVGDLCPRLRFYEKKKKKRKKKKKKGGGHTEEIILRAF